MKKLGKLKLNQLNKASLESKELRIIRGGCSCPCNCVCVCGSGECPCSYAGEQCPSGDDLYGGSSTADNLAANAYSPGNDLSMSDGGSLSSSLGG